MTILNPWMCCRHGLELVRHYFLEHGLLQTRDYFDFIIIQQFIGFDIMQTWIQGRKSSENGKNPYQQNTTFLI